MTETTTTTSTTTADTLLKAIVNLDENQLRNVDDERSFGTAADIADGERSQQCLQQQQANGNEVPASPQDCDSNGDTENKVNNDRRNRLKNAIVFKWKTHRLLSTIRQSEEQHHHHQQQLQLQFNDEDVEASYVALDDTATTTTTTISSKVSSALSSLKLKSANSFQNAKKSILTSLHEDDKPSATASHSTLQPKLSAELFHWYIHRSWKKKLLTLLVATSSAFVLYDLFTGGNDGKVHTFVNRFLDWMNRHPVWGVYAYIGVLALASRECLVTFGAVADVCLLEDLGWDVWFNGN